MIIKKNKDVHGRVLREFAFVECLRGEFEISQ